VLRLLSIIILLSFFFTSTIAPVSAAISYSYDANGNMTSDGTRCFEYNDANQLKKVKTCANNQTIAEYLYDHTGKRLVKKEFENGTLKHTIYSPTDEYETKKLANGTTENTTHFKVNDEVVAKINPDGSINYFHNDHLGSTSVLTGQSGNVVEKTSYEPYGEVKTGGTKSKFQYTGQEKDQETGLNYYDARYYDPQIQRFTQPDTLIPDVYDPQQLNRYAYANNNPVKYIDPSGNFGIVFWVGAVLIGALAAASMPAVVPNNKNENWLASGGYLVNHYSTELTKAVHNLTNTKSSTKTSTTGTTSPNIQQQKNDNQKNGGGKSGGSEGGGSTKPERSDPSKWVKDNFNNPEKGPPGWKEFKYGDKPTDRNFHNPKTKESLGPDEPHGNIKRHWDYKDSNKQWWRIFEDGKMEMK
jgi:RHS repeat-associated protein